MSKIWNNNLLNFIVDEVVKVVEKVDKTVGEVVLKVNPTQLREEQKQESEERLKIKEEFQKRVDENVLEKVKNGDVILIEGYNEDKLGQPSKIMTGNELLKKINNLSWSFEKGPTAKDTENAKIIKNAYTASSVILSNKIGTKPPIIEEETIEKLQKKIKCIECSIKKLELNLKLTNEDGIKDEEFLTLLTKISGLCGSETGAEDCETNLQEFVDEVILKRDMNSIAGLIKMASFMCPILAFANKSLFSDLTEEAAKTSEVAEKTVGICSKIIGYITRSGNDGELSIEDTATELDFIDKIHGIGVTEAIVSFVGIGGANKEGGIENKIKGSIRSVVRRTVKNTIDTVLKTATLYQKIICMVFITLLSTHIYLTLCNNNGNVNETEQYYKSSIEFLYNNMTNETMKIGFGDMKMLNSTTTGGKRASKSRRAANAAKPRATRASKAVSIAIAKAVAKPKPANATKPNPKAPTAKPTKTPPKPTAKPTNAKAAPKKKKN